MADKRIENFKKTINKLDSWIKTNHVYTMWIRFRVGGLDIDTSSTSLYGKRSNYFMSLENVKNGSGQANSFTLNIAYVPEPGEDADFIDKAIAYSNRECILQYGYGMGVEGLYTPEYKGLVLDYEVGIRDGMLFYTITGYSSLVAITEETFDFPAINSSSEDGGDSENRRPTKVVKAAFTDKLEKYGYIVDTSNESDLTDLPEDTIPEALGVTVFQYASSVLSYARDESQAELSSDDISKKIIYNYYIDDTKDSNGKTKITIFKTDPSDTNKNDSKVVFNWMDKSNSIVIDFKTEFKGAVVIGRAYKDINNDSSNKKYSLDIYGNKVESNNGNNDASTSGAVSEQDDATDLTTWAEATQYSYKATLVLLGVPCEIPIGMMIEILPLIYGKPHHTQGKYMVTKATDNLDSSGFITTLELVKLNADEINKAAENISAQNGSSSK